MWKHTTLTVVSSRSNTRALGSSGLGFLPQNDDSHVCVSRTPAAEAVGGGTFSGAAGASPGNMDTEARKPAGIQLRGACSSAAVLLVVLQSQATLPRPLSPHLESLWMLC